MDSSHSHEDGINCFMCSGGSREDMERWQDDMIAKHGFYMHFVDSPEQGYMNSHTHGFSHTWGHLDFQVVIYLDPKVVSKIFWELADRVKNGEIFQAGMKVERIIKDYPVHLELARENDRDVLRVILPDANGLFPGDPDVDGFFERQLQVENPDNQDQYLN